MIKTYFLLFVFLFFSLNSNASLTPQRIEQIKVKAFSVNIEDAHHVFQVRQDSQFKGPAASRKVESGGYELVMNPEIMKFFTEAAQILIFYHELGHFYLGHLDQPYLNDEDYRTQIEFEADTFSAYLFKKNGHPTTGLRLFISILNAQTDTLPPGPERALIFEKILFDDLKK